MTDPAPYRIETLAAQGDGLAIEDGRQVYVPFTLPGESVLASGAGARKSLDAVVEASRDRVEAFCPHFGTCGGCQVQHLADPVYWDWKTGLLRQALAREGLEADPQPMIRFDRASRRRAVLTARHSGSGWILGFAQRGSHALVDINACPVLTGPLNAALPALRGLLGVFAVVRRDIRIHLLAADNGLDVAFSFAGKPPQGIVRSLTTHENARAFGRIAINGETVLERQRPVLKAGLAQVCPPPGAFVQASLEAEQAMADLVCGHLAGSKRVADLFSGFGAFALRLAKNSIVHAAESEAAPLDALDRAWRETGGALKSLSHEKRDLFRRPMMAKELKSFQGVVFDPPRAGAEAQARQLAQSAVRRIAAVSCNPETLARDLRILVDGGYRIDSVTPVDQFAFTPHLEAVALLSR